MCLLHNMEELRNFFLCRGTCRENMVSDYQNEQYGDTEERNTFH